MSPERNHEIWKLFEIVFVHLYFLYVVNNNSVVYANNSLIVTKRFVRDIKNYTKFQIWL